MRLKRIHLTDFRGYQGLVSIDIDKDLTGIVGKNDFGKSTILDALSIFFEADGVKSDKNDMNCFQKAHGKDCFEISCEFDQLPEAIILDEYVSTSLKSEYLLDKSDLFHLKKTYKGSTGKLDKTVIVCEHPSNEKIKNLLNLKLSDLKNIGKDIGIDEKVADKRISSLWREAIRNHFKVEGLLELSTQELNIEKEFSSEGKSLWKKIEVNLPVFALFRADRESNDVDPEAKNPLQQAVKEAQEKLRLEIDHIEKEIQDSVLDVANRTLDKLREMAPELANELTPQFREKPKWTFNFTLDGENGIPINKRGSGVRRLILLNFFRAEAEKSVSGNGKNIIYAIEEPETSQHPNYQIMLMKSLLSLSQKENRQIIVTTHVPALAGLIPVDAIRYVTKSIDGKPKIEMPSPDIISEVADSLGVLPAKGAERAKAVVLVEGKSDVTFFRHASKVLKESHILSNDFTGFGIVPIAVGGCGNVKFWVTQRQLDELELPWCVFLDSDKGGSPEQEKSILKRKKKLKVLENHFFSTRKREIENYILPEVVFRVSNVHVSYTDTCDAKKIISKNVHMKDDDVFDYFWPHMTAENIIKSSTYQKDGHEYIEVVETIKSIVTCLTSIT